MFVEPTSGAGAAADHDDQVEAAEAAPSHRFDIEVEGTHNYFVDGVMVHNSPETTPGGRALKFYSSVRLDIRRIETIKDGTEMVGNRTRVKVVKNKVAPPFKQAEFDIMYGKGISREGGLIDVGVERGHRQKSGAWYTYEGEQLGQGKENSRSFLHDNPDLANEIEKKILEKLGVGPTVVTDEVPRRRPSRSASTTSDRPDARGLDHKTSDQAPGSTSGSTDAWTGGVETGVRAWVGDHSPAPPPDLPRPTCHPIEPRARTPTPSRWPARSCSTS